MSDKLLAKIDALISEYGYEPVAQAVWDRGEELAFDQFVGQLAAKAEADA